MKKLSTLAGTLLLVGTLSAQPMGGMSGMGKTGSGMMGMHGMMSGMGGGMMGMHGMMGVKFPHLLMKAQRMAPDKARALKDLAGRRIPEWIRTRAEVQVAAFELQQALASPEISDRDLARAFSRYEKARGALEKLNRDAILELRKALGADAFARLFSMPMKGSMPGPSGMPSPKMQEMMNRTGNMPMMQPAPGGQTSDAEKNGR